MFELRDEKSCTIYSFNVLIVLCISFWFCSSSESSLRCSNDLKKRSEASTTLESKFLKINGMDSRFDPIKLEAEESRRRDIFPELHLCYELRKRWGRQFFWCKPSREAWTRNQALTWTPVTVAMHAPHSIFYYKTGVFSENSCPNNLDYPDHKVMVVG